MWRSVTGVTGEPEKSNDCRVHKSQSRWDIFHFFFRALIQFGTLIYHDLRFNVILSVAKSEIVKRKKLLWYKNYCNEPTAARRQTIIAARCCEASRHKVWNWVSRKIYRKQMLDYSKQREEESRANMTAIETENSQTSFDSWWKRENWQLSSLFSSSSRQMNEPLCAMLMSNDQMIRNHDPSSCCCTFPTNAEDTHSWSIQKLK